MFIDFFSEKFYCLCVLIENMINVFQFIITFLKN